MARDNIRGRCSRFHPRAIGDREHIIRRATTEGLFTHLLTSELPGHTLHRRTETFGKNIAAEGISGERSLEKNNG